MFLFIWGWHLLPFKSMGFVTRGIIPPLSFSSTIYTWLPQGCVHKNTTLGVGRGGLKVNDYFRKISKWSAIVTDWFTSGGFLCRHNYQCLFFWHHLCHMLYDNLCDSNNERLRFIHNKFYIHVGFCFPTGCRRSCVSIWASQIMVKRDSQLWNLLPLLIWDCLNWMTLRHVENLTSFFSPQAVWKWGIIVRGEELGF